MQAIKNNMESKKFIAATEEKEGKEKKSWWRKIFSK